jgi:hypothetical protein
MKPEEVWTWIDDALVHFSDDETTLDLKIGERALTGRLLIHLETAFLVRHKEMRGSGWWVDTEYNKVGTDIKRLPELDRILDELENEMGWPRKRIPRRKTTRINPDLILHQRKSGPEKGNGVVGEVKRASARIEKLAFDVGKLVRFRQYLNYDYAFLILLGGPRSACRFLPVGREVADGANVLRAIDEARKDGHLPTQPAPQSIALERTSLRLTL